MPEHLDPRPPEQITKTVLANAETLCRERGVRWTTLRRRVLEIILTCHQPIGAYQILRVLSREKGHAAPPTVYRTLDFLLTQGLVHHLVSINAYQACQHPRNAHNAQFCICKVCGQVSELADDRIEQAVEAASSDSGFAADNQVVEIVGHCQRCRHSGGAG